METIEKRERRNLILFIISYVINNLASGFLYDTYINYLQEVSLSIATSFWAFYGYATFISAGIIILVPKIGYKKLLLCCSLFTSTAFFCAVYTNTDFFLYIATLLALTGVQLHFIMLAPFISIYTENMSGKEIKWYTRAYYMGYVGYLAATYIGGVSVVYTFSKLGKLTFKEGKYITKFIMEMPSELYELYIMGNKQVLFIMGVLCVLALIPIILIQEKREDYKKEEIVDSRPLKEKILENIKVLFNRNARIYLIYWTLVSFAMGLFTSYYTVYLNRVLHIDKVTSSLLVSISYLAIIVFMFFTPLAVRKFGEVGTIFLTMILTCPFMILIGNADKFGSLMIPIVGTSLFFRAGLANLSSPADSSLSMKIVPKEMRPAYTAVINFLAGFISVLSGIYTGKVLFKSLDGYRYAYFIAAVLYFIAALVIYLGLKKYNRKTNY